jgi:16S rRNA (adenine1518-N6/adenine1519-N6)-dimethyltransferase
MKLSEMRQLLSEEGIQLTKSLGQNFLHDANQLRRIVKLAEVGTGDSVLEIGPGLGPLTEILLKNAGNVLAVEKDRRLVAFLERRFGDLGNFELVGADAMDYLRDRPRDLSTWKIVSNLPYSVGSPLLVELARNPRRPSLIVVTLQLEVVQRLLAASGSAHYGLLTVLIQAWYQPAGWFKIPGSCFFPQPDVDSGTIKLVRRYPALLSEDVSPTFFRVVKQGFSQRRKMMFKLLRELCPEDLLREAFKAAEVREQARAEMAGPEQFAKIATFLHNAGAPFA